MDPVSVFNALHDTKCIKFGRYELKSGLVAPYYINLRRLPLYPRLMEAVATQVAEKFLTNQALTVTMARLRQQRRRSSSSASRVIRSALVDSINRELQERLKVSEKERQLTDGTDSDSQLGEEDIETCSEDCEDWESLGGGGYNLDPIIVGVPFGAIPVAATIAFKARLPFLFERGEPKLHGDPQPLIEDFNEETRSVYPVGKRIVRGATMRAEAEDGESAMRQRQRQQVILIEDVICSGESVLEAVRQLEEQNLKVEFVICIIDREENGINLLLQQAGIHVISLYKISAILRVLETTGRITSKQFISTRQWIDENQFKTIGVDPSIATTPTPTKAQLAPLPRPIDHRRQTATLT